MIDRLSDEARAVCAFALPEALKLGHNYIQPEHLILTMIQQEDSILALALGELGVEPSALRRAIFRVLSGQLQR